MINIISAPLVVISNTITIRTLVGLPNYGNNDVINTLSLISLNTTIESLC